MPQDPAAAQQTGVLTGRVVSDSTGQPVAQASVQVEDSFRGAAADAEGRFVLELPAGEHIMRVGAVGFVDARRQVNVVPGDTTEVRITLVPEAMQLGTITVEGASLTGVHQYRLTPESIESAPALGEPDLVRALARLPGLMQPNDAKARLSVWGGAAGQNQYLLDGIPIYSPAHLGGMFSALNPRVLESATVHAGQFSARHGGRLSSVLQAEMTSSPDTSLARAHLSMLSASLSSAKQFGDTFVLAGLRRTYLDPVMIAADIDLRYNFRDAYLKVRQDLGRGYRLSLTGFAARDYYGEPARGQDGLDPLYRWGNRLGAIRLVKDAGRLRHRLTGSIVHKYVTGSSQSIRALDNDLIDQRLAYEGQWTGSRTSVEAGLSATGFRLFHDWDTDYLPLEHHFAELLPRRFTDRKSERVIASYLSARRQLPGPWSLRAGLRYTAAGALDGGELAPRAELTYQPAEWARLTAGAGRYVQRLGPTSATVGGEAAGPADLQIAYEEPVFLLDRPQVAWTYSIGSELTPWAGYRIRATAYYRPFTRLAWMDYEGSGPYPQITYGRGRAPGAHLFLQKRSGWLTFQLGYAFSNPRVRRDGFWHPAAWNVPHAGEGMLGFELGPWQVSVSGQYRSGLPYTPAAGRMLGPTGGWLPRLHERRPFPGTERGRLQDIYVEGPPYSARFAPYGRMDLALRRQYENRYLDWELYVQAINVLNTNNLVGGAPRAGPTESSLPIIPSVGVDLHIK